MADKSSIIQAAQSELRKHSFDTFIDRPPSIAQGGSGVVIFGCRACKMRFNTHGRFLEHLAKDVLPKIIEKTLGD